MSADAMLWNPAFFAGLFPDPCDLICEYIEIYKRRPERTRKQINSHVFGISSALSLLFAIIFCCSSLPPSPSLLLLLFPFLLSHSFSSLLSEILRKTFDLCPEYRKKYNINLDYDKMITLFRQLKIDAGNKRAALEKEKKEKEVKEREEKEPELKVLSFLSFSPPPLSLHILSPFR